MEVNILTISIRSSEVSLAVYVLQLPYVSQVYYNNKGHQVSYQSNTQQLIQ